MKRFAVLSLLLLGGCVVQSFHPFYREQAKVNPPEVTGEWNLVAAGSDTNVACKPWVFSADNELTTYDENNLPAKLKATFFKIGNQLFCDFEPGEVEEGKLNAYWILHVRPVHTVAKVQLDKQQLTLIPLNFDWFKKSLAANQIDLPCLKGHKEHDFLLTASPEQWAGFLEKYAANTNAFPQNTAYVLRKRL